jgi:hypothetical protein
MIAGEIPVAPGYDRFFFATNQLPSRKIQLSPRGVACAVTYRRSSPKPSRSIRQYYMVKVPAPSIAFGPLGGVGDETRPLGNGHRRPG